MLVVLAADVRWTFGIGDPTPVGWLTVAAYVVGAALSVRAVVTARTGERRFAYADPNEARDQRSMKHLWLLIAVTMVLLGVNKQLDLQTLLIQKVRNRAYANGWYSDRRRYQVDFIAAISVMGLFATIGLAIWLRRVFGRVLLAIAGIAMLVLFVVIRAASFHYVDKVLSLGGRVRVNWIIELSGIGLIIVAAIRWQRIEQRHIQSCCSSTTTANDLILPPSSMV
jgi:hypothetical protein